MITYISNKICSIAVLLGNTESTSMASLAVLGNYKIANDCLCTGAR